MLFSRHGSTCVATLDAVESEVLRSVLGEVLELVGADDLDRGDPVIERLFPDYYPDDHETSGDLHRYTDDDLKATKVEQAGAVLATLPPGGGTVRLTDEEAEAWLRALTDARVALGLRIDVRDDTDLEGELIDAVENDPASARVQHLWVYHFLTMLQGSLIEAVAGS
jgi:hypothetical protein